MVSQLARSNDLYLSASARKLLRLPGDLGGEQVGGGKSVVDVGVVVVGAVEGGWEWFGGVS